ncbi:MAG: hypothetical protein ACUVQ8_02145 [Nitrososphaeria archaeon]
MTRERKALSRILTEIIFMVVGISAVIGSFSIYNGYMQDGSQVCRLACTDTVAVAGLGQVYATVKNIGTADTNVTINGILESGTGISVAIISATSSRLEPGKEQTITAKVDGIKAGVKYSIMVVGRSGKKISTYLIVETIAAP